MWGTVFKNGKLKALSLPQGVFKINSHQLERYLIFLDTSVTEKKGIVLLP